MVAKVVRPYPAATGKRNMVAKTKITVAGA